VTGDNHDVQNDAVAVELEAFDADVIVGTVWSAGFHKHLIQTVRRGWCTTTNGLDLAAEKATYVHLLESLAQQQTGDLDVQAKTVREQSTGTSATPQKGALSWGQVCKDLVDRDTAAMAARH
jgi:methionyl-tRNA formyltransferase